jgi:glycosyltransferase involved in cell wall biosynthesis
VGSIPDGGLVLLDGLVGSTAPEVLTLQAGRVRLVVLVHMPLGYGTTNGGPRRREGAALLAAASVLATSSWARRVLLELYPLSSDHVHVVEPGVDPAELAPGTATAGALLSVAAVIPAKGHDVLIEALAPLTGFQWRCQCIGSLERDPDFVRLLRRRILDGGMDGRVRFSGPQAEADLAHSYAAADVLVLPSRGETYGMVIAEALARGLPVVAAEVGGVPEALGRGVDGSRPGLLVPPSDPASLGDALRSWLEDAGLRLRLRAAARERRASLPDWSTTTSAMAEALREAAR